MTIQTDTSPMLANGGRKIALQAACTGAATSDPTADSRNKNCTFTRTAKGAIRATLRQTGTVYPMSVQVKTLHVGTNSVKVAASVKAFDTAAGTVDIECINEACPAQVSYAKAADAAANTATAETVILQLPAACTIASAEILPTASVTADASNNASITLMGYTAAGGSVKTLATLVTDVAGGSWTAFVKKSMTLTATTADLDREADSVITLTITKGGSGVQLPAAVYRVTLDRHIDLTTSEKLHLDIVISEYAGV